MTINKTEKRIKRHSRIRTKISGTTERPRLSVFKSNKQLYAQIIDDTNGTTLASANSLKMEGKTSNQKADLVAKEISKAAATKNIKSVVFDRGGFLYAGNIKIFAETARKAGLIF